MILLIVSSFITFTIPDLQNSRVDDVWYLLLLSILIMGLMVSIKSRSKSLIRRSRNARFRHYRNKVSVALNVSPQKAKSIVLEELNRIGWKADQYANADQFILEKGRSGIWGSIIFHVGLVITAAGLIIALLFSYEGILRVTEGEVIKSPESTMRLVREGMLASNPLNDINSVALIDAEEDYVFKGGQTFSSIVRINQENEDRIHRDKPLTISGFAMNQGKWGKTVGLIIRLDGQIIQNGWIRLSQSSNSSEAGFKDYLILNDGSRMDLRLFPTEETSRYQKLQVSFLDQNDQSVSGILIQGQTVLLENYEVSFVDERYWSQLEIANHAGYPLLLMGFVLVTIGLTLRAFFVHRLIVVSIASGNSTHIELSGWTEKFQYSHQVQLDTLYANIKGYSKPLKTVHVFEQEPVPQAMELEV